MSLVGGWVLPLVWGLLGVTIIVGAVAARQSRTAYVTAIWAVSVLWVLAGAGANLAMLLDGADYSGFASGSPLSFVRETWESLVVPNHHYFIGTLIGCEAVVGSAVLWPGRARTVSLVILVLFNVTLVAFGWGFLFWAAPITFALVLLLRAQRRWHGGTLLPDDPGIKTRRTGPFRTVLDGRAQHMLGPVPGWTPGPGSVR